MSKEQYKAILEWSIPPVGMKLALMYVKSTSASHTLKLGVDLFTINMN